MAADDNVANAKRSDSEFNDRTDATQHLAVGWHHIPDVPGYKYFSRGRVGDCYRVDARVGARDE
jgi:hypothetical protein